MVDFLGMFRRRAPKRGPQGFARSHSDITALGDNIGDLLTSPVRDAPPLLRDTPREVAQVQVPVPKKAAPAPEKPKPRAKTNGVAAPRLATRAWRLPRPELLLMLQIAAAALLAAAHLLRRRSERMRTV